MQIHIFENTITKVDLNRKLFYLPSIIRNTLTIFMSLECVSMPVYMYNVTLIYYHVYPVLSQCFKHSNLTFALDNSQSRLTINLLVCNIDFLIITS